MILNGHSVPINNLWLEKALNNFKDKRVAAVTGDYTYADKSPSILDKIKISGANMTNTNSIIRKDLWEQYRFDESLSGAEDYDWGLEMMSRGYKVIKDPAFLVRHYHFITPEIRKYWKEMVEIIEAKKRPAPIMHKAIHQIRKFI